MSDLQIIKLQIQKHKPLSNDQVLELLERYHSTGCNKVKQKIVLHNLRLVLFLAKKYHVKYGNISDLVQEGSIGLVKAIEKYDPKHNTKFNSYASLWIKAYLLRYCTNNDSLVKFNTTEDKRKLFFNYKKISNKLAREGVKPTPELISEISGVPLEIVKEAEIALNTTSVSLNLTCFGHNDGASHEVQNEKLIKETTLKKGNFASPEDACIQKDLMDKYNELITTYSKKIPSEKDSYIVNERLKSSSLEDPPSYQELGSKFGVTRQRADQICKQHLSKIQGMIMNNIFGD